MHQLPQFIAVSLFSRASAESPKYAPFRVHQHMPVNHLRYARFRSVLGMLTMNKRVHGQAKQWLWLILMVLFHALGARSAPPSPTRYSATPC